MKSILRSLAVLAVLAGFAGSAFAQDTNNDIIRPITKSGSAAFLFTLNGLGTFGVGSAPLAPGLGNAGFGMKYFVSDDLAMRVLVGLSMSSVDTPESSTSMFGLGVGAEYHFRPLYSTSPYIGGQVGFSTSGTSSGSGDTESSTTNTFIGVSALAGFDWFFTRGIAVGAEVALGLVMHSSSSDFGSNSSDGPATTTIGFNSPDGASNGNVHVVVYF